MITLFIGVIIALVGVIYRLFSSTIDLKIDLKIASLRKELGLEIEHLQNDKRIIKSLNQCQLKHNKKNNEF